MEGLGLLISIVTAIYLAVSAPKYNKNPWLWGILGFFFSLTTLGVFFIKTRRAVIGWILVVISSIFVILTILAILVMIAALSGATM